MRHRVRGRKLGRKSAPRKALLEGLARALILNEEGRITTTIAKAKEVRPFVEKLVTLSRHDDQSKRRRALRLLSYPNAVAKLFDEIGPRYKERPGGYTRIVRWDKRLGDKAQRAIIEFVVDVEPQQQETPTQEEPTQEAAPETPEESQENEKEKEEEQEPEKEPTSSDDSKKE